MIWIMDMKKYIHEHQMVTKPIIWGRKIRPFQFPSCKISKNVGLATKVGVYGPLNCKKPRFSDN